MQGQRQEYKWRPADHYVNQGLTLFALQKSGSSQLSVWQAGACPVHCRVFNSISGPPCGKPVVIFPVPQVQPPEMFPDSTFFRKPEMNIKLLPGADASSGP